MKTKLWQLWVNLRSSFWFAPAVMMLGAAALAMVLVDIDASAKLSLADRYPHVFGANAEGARSILSTIASSMINIAGVTFSITIVALSLATGQYTSRILRNFMRDRANQGVLGVFVSVFVYCVVVLRTIRGGTDSFVPSLSVAVGIALGVLGIAFLIFFIHHIATSIQASSIISRVAEETLAVIDTLYPEPHRGEEDSDGEAERWIRALTWQAIPAGRTGYLQTIDRDGLADWAVKHDCAVRMRRGIGEFVVAEQPCLAFASDHPLDDEALRSANACFSTASFRTIEEDPAFGLRQLVDIALKALSPGINDTTTAVACLDYLGAILARVSRRHIPSELRRRDGRVRLIVCAQTFDRFADEAFAQILEHSRGNVAVLRGLLDLVAAADHPELHPARRSILAGYAQRVLRAATTQIGDEIEQDRIRRRFQELSVLPILSASRKP